MIPGILYNSTTVCISVGILLINAFCSITICQRLGGKERNNIPTESDKNQR